jgi:hypothetical protein
MPIDDILLDCEEQMDKALEHPARTPRPHGARACRLVEDLDYYGAPPAQIDRGHHRPEATQLLIRPFSLQDIKGRLRRRSTSKIA